MKPAVAKPVKWKPWRHPFNCVGCSAKFRRGDQIVEVGCLAIHYNRDCAEEYIKDSKALGIEPDIRIVKP